MTAAFCGMRTNRSVRSDLSGSTVLVACRGDQVSSYTSVGDVLLKDKLD